MKKRLIAPLFLLLFALLCGCAGPVSPGASVLSSSSANALSEESVSPDVSADVSAAPSDASSASSSTEPASSRSPAGSAVSSESNHGVSVAPPPVSAPAASSSVVPAADTVTVTVIGLDGKVVLAATPIVLTKNASVLDVTEQALETAKIPFIVRSSYISSIDGLAERAHGVGSGWVYLVNDTMGKSGSREYVVRKNDRITWKYTKNLGKDAESK